MEKRYQVFVSSTYADLKEERQRVIQTIIELDCIPAGMELFPAADEEQLEFIKRVIDDCDYYLLIVGGRYGSTTEEGVSYTEQEYDYAVSCGLKVIALLHANPSEIAFGKSEGDPVLREKLSAFRKKIETGRLVKHWNTVEDLPGIVSLSLSRAIKMFPAVGWVRADRAANVDVLSEINELRKENADLQVRLTEFEAATQPEMYNLAGLDDRFEVSGTYFDKYFRRTSPWTAKHSWGDIFAYIAPYLIRFPSDADVKAVLDSALFATSGKTGDGESPHLNDQIFRTIAVQLSALGLLRVEYMQNTKGGMGLFWSLTTAGERVMFDRRVVRKETESTT